MHSFLLNRYFLFHGIYFLSSLGERSMCAVTVEVDGESALLTCVEFHEYIRLLTFCA